MVFSMNVFKNKKRWQNIKNVKKRALNKNVKNVFYIYVTKGIQPAENAIVRRFP